MKLLTHRIAFNCDLFLDIDAPETATSADLEKLVVATIREAASDPDNHINDVGLDINGHRGFRARIYPRVTPEGSELCLENFTIENVEEAKS